VNDVPLDVPILILKFLATTVFIISAFYGYRNYRVTRSYTWLFLEISLIIASLLSLLRLIKEFLYLDFARFKTLIEVIEFTKISLIPIVTAFLLAALIVLRKETKRVINKEKIILPEHRVEPLSKYNVKRGISYLIKEETPSRIYTIFQDLLSLGYKGLCITRTQPAELREKYGMKDVQVLFLSNIESEEGIPLKFMRGLERSIEEFFWQGGKKVLLLERLDYLQTQVGFAECFRFISKLNTLTYMNNCVSLLQVDPLTLGERELRLVEKETQILKPRELDLTEDLFEVLEYIHSQNNAGTKPSLKDITKRFSITRNTAAKRVNILKSTNLVMVSKKGRQKVLMLTKNGEELLL
jgi:predicted transcriptional regulator